MRRPSLNTDREFDIMVTYQIIIESQSVVIKNCNDDEFPFSLYEVNEPFPSYDEYRNGNDFDEGQMIMNSISLSMLEIVQQERRKSFKPMLNLV